ncbi:MAG: hypothetical protein PF694_09640 [Bacteroidetes bacterium]|nr:hypothetical protein [Bacteroidota bacterium]
MKKIIVTALFLLSISFGASQLSAQAPPPPPDGHGATGNQDAGGGAPIGGGLGILLALGAAYGGRKVYRAWKDQQEE